MLQASNEKQETVSHHGNCSIPRKLLLQATSKSKYPTKETTNVMERTLVESPPWIHKDAGHK
jgi:hypothetical protein